jgi:hypothetical protein
MNTTTARDLSGNQGDNRPEDPTGRKRAVFKYTIPPDAQLGTCKGPNCGKDVWWFKYKNKRGGLSTVCADADGTPHHGTCPDVDQFRKKAS